MPASVEKLVNGVLDRPGGSRGVVLRGFFETSLRHQFLVGSDLARLETKRTAKACQSASEIEIRAAYDVV